MIRRRTDEVDASKAECKNNEAVVFVNPSKAECKDNGAVVFVNPYEVVLILVCVEICTEYTRAVLQRFREGKANKMVSTGTQGPTAQPYKPMPNPHNIIQYDVRQRVAILYIHI